MNAPKYQHYVPRFYLARFIDHDGFLWVFDKSKGQTFRLKPENIGGESHFYDVPELEQFGAARSLMENQLAEIESEAQKITECWLRQVKDHTRVEIPDPNRDIMSLFLTLQLLRTAEARTVLVQFVQLLQRLGEVSSTYNAKEDAQSLHRTLLWDDELIKEFRTKIAECIWIFAFNDSGQPFYTSDHPALVKSYDNKMWMLGPRVFEHGMYIVFPLTPQWILYCKEREYWHKVAKFDQAVSPVQFTPDMVNHENSGQVGMCSRFVFSNSADFRFAKEYCNLAPGVVDNNRDRFEELPPLD
jgi:hypothetical protein